MIWRVALDVPRDALAPFAQALDEVCEAVVTRLEPAAGEPVLAGYSRKPPDPVMLSLALDLAATAAGIEVPIARVDTVVDQDWLALSAESFPPLHIGRFTVLPEEDPAEVRPGKITLVVNPGVAFGSGHHASTAGCLLALSRLAPRPVRHALDMGCGSGILAMAMARLWHADVLAVDIDRRAVEVTVENARRNQVGNCITARFSDGYRSPEVGRRTPFDIVTANVLARPLRSWAIDLGRVLRPGGLAVLAGFLPDSAPGLLSAHRLAGLRLSFFIDEGGWRTLVLQKPERQP